MLSMGVPIRAILITLLIVSGCGVAAAQDSTAQDTNFQACVDARLAADEETSATEWFFTGCMPNGIHAAKSDVPEPPVAALVGRSKDYVDRFTECYEIEARAIRKRWAQLGCLIGLPLQLFTTRW
jgi:hypothetical protein